MSQELPAAEPFRDDADKPAPPVCPPGSEAVWVSTEEGGHWECQPIKTKEEEVEPQSLKASIPIEEQVDEVEKVDPRQLLKDKAVEFADACNYAVENGVPVMEVMTIASSTLTQVGG